MIYECQRCGLKKRKIGNFKHKTCPSFKPFAHSFKPVYETQVHHISYEPEHTIRILKVEHGIISHLNRMKTKSNRFDDLLKAWIEQPRNVVALSQEGMK